MHTTGASALYRRFLRQAKILEGNLVLTPVDNFPGIIRYRAELTDFHGIYASDKLRSEVEQKSAKIQFAGRQDISKEISKIHEKLAKAFKCSHASLRLLSGLHAHIVLFMALAKIGSKVALLPVEAGGHFATPDILERLGLKVLSLPVDYNQKCLDIEGSLALLKQEKPDILFIDRSEGLKFESFSELGQTPVPIKIFDCSQYVPQIMADIYDNPFDWGFNVQVMTLHKSFPGPQKAAVLSNNDFLWREIIDGLGRFVSSSHIENSLLAGLVLEEQRDLNIYAERLLTTKFALEEELYSSGVAVISTDQIGKATWPATHHIWIGMPHRDAAFSYWRLLEKNRIQTNYRLLPYGLGWGLRLGVTAAVSRGMLPSDAKEAGRIISSLLQDPKTANLRKDVTNLVHSMRPNALFSGAKNE